MPEKPVIFKAGLAWSGVGASEMLGYLGINNWSDAAGMLAALYSAVLIIDWCFKKFKGRR